MSCDVGEATEGAEEPHSSTLPSLHLRHSSFYNPSFALSTSQLILQSFRRFTYVTANFRTLLSLYLRHSSFSNSSVASPTSQLIFHSFASPTPGSPEVTILASGSEVRGYDPGRGRWIFSERRNPEYDFLRKGSKAAGPVSYIYGT